MATAFTLRTFRGLLQRMINRVVATSPLTDLNDGSSVKQVLAAVAAVGEQLSVDMGRLLTLFSLDRAEGEDLDARAREYMPDGFERKIAERAQGTIRFTRSAGGSAIPLPVGTLVARTVGGRRITYATTAPGEIPAGPDGTISARTDGVIGDIPIRADQAGAVGDAEAGTITELVTGVPGIVGISNPTPTKGADAETDDAFRARIRARTRALARCTPESLETRVLDATSNGRHLTTARSFRVPGSPAYAVIYVDDGAGAAAETAPVDGEALVESATGGERRFYTTRKPWVGADYSLIYTPSGQPPVNLQRGVEYEVIRSSGLVELSDDLAAFPDGLAAGDRLEIAPYQVYTGLIAEAQRLIDGDPADPERYPAWRAEGVVIEVRPPAILWMAVSCAVVVLDGFNRSTVLSRVRAAVAAYFTELQIGEDVVLHELVERTMAISGVYDVAFESPDLNVAVGDTELARAAQIEVL